MKKELPYLSLVLLIVSIFVFFFVSSNSPNFVVTNSLYLQDSYLAAIRGSYSNHQPFSHSTNNRYLSGPQLDQSFIGRKYSSSTPILTSTSTTTIVPTSTTTQTTTSTITPTSTLKPTATTTVNSTTTVKTPTTTVVTATTTNPLNGRVGMSVGATPYWVSDTVLNNELSDMYSMGIRWLRFDVEWDQVQLRSSSTFNWVPTDRVMKMVLAHGIQPLPILAYSPTWAQPITCSGGFFCGPANPNDYANFAKVAAARYAPMGVHTWEIWNEPNTKQFWKPAPDPIAYSALLKGAYAAIKSVDSSAFVVSGGLAPAATTNGEYSPMDFLKALYAQGDKAYFDGFGFHPYSYPALPSQLITWNAWSQMASTSPSLRSIMNSNGDTTKPIWMTEFGAPTGGPGPIATLSNPNFNNAPDHVDETMQAQNATDALNYLMKTPSSGPLFWYSYQDIGTDPVTNENFFGVIRYDGSLKPAYLALKNLLTR